jgi:hypothetical protein
MKRGKLSARPVFTSKVIERRFASTFQTLLVMDGNKRRSRSMAEKRMLIVSAELVKRINENRGDMSQAEFIDFLMDSQLKEETKELKDIKEKYVTREEIHIFEQDMKSLMKRALDFFVSYGLELGKQSPKSEFEELSSRLRELEDDLASEDKSKRATIKWK